ncbi:hypothetical protein EPUS_06086 [Endocarpon pusillum Z07020]|uniref:Uncharacterized protein n=1 Tax=Endocarpon pusillum (strain Z07020 / HMAS-L-300199) TaxID=1263415 RepID=U1HPK8_ENDPU|nr:uncharacterized protein EPUS_06086 [Endocarpon pusillum Z07020]ERF72330.1 hypothetical protein EPUS_06086 [Endocarpon pusillum Z07020]
MNWLSQARGAGDTGQESSLRQDSSNERPGKFPHLSEFMTIDKDYQPKDVPGTQAPVDSGHVIYIKDTSAKDTRINDRVMLVLFHNQPFSHTCLSFCCHSDFSGETLNHSHALVYTDQGQQTAPQLSQAQQPNIGLPRLEINLRHNNTPFSLQPDIYLNLREHWNVEQEVRFVILGRVERSSYQRLVPEIERLFCQSISGVDIVKDRGNPLPPNGQESASLERKKSNRKDKVHGTTREKRRDNISHWPISASFQRQEPGA